KIMSADVMSLLIDWFKCARGLDIFLSILKENQTSFSHLHDVTIAQQIRFDSDIVDTYAALTVDIENEIAHPAQAKLSMMSGHVRIVDADVVGRRAPDTNHRTIEQFCPFTIDQEIGVAWRCTGSGFQSYRLKGGRRRGRSGMLRQYFEFPR
ncbi:MAG: hypothetical protein NZM00_12350, partial [Anaerolinea sp.]|nr:hypothetical protein [Anaerolinea sp.]